MLFTGCIKKNIRGITIFILFAAIYIISFALYHLPVAAVLYPTFICSVLGISFLICDYVRIRRKHKFLTNIKTIDDLNTVSLPEASSVIEREYQNIITNMLSETNSVRNKAESKYRDAIDYYTVWLHQIKTPIASMKLTLEGTDSHLSRRISSDLFRIEQYVGMVLAFLRLGSDRTDYVIREISLDYVIRGTAKKFAREFIDRKLYFNYRSAEEFVVTDEKWFSFALEQIMSNALKYTRSGGVSVYVRDGKYLCVEDTGIGIAPEDLPRIFEKGYTGYNGRIDKSASGLGLYLTKQVLDRLRHNVFVSSELGRGTVISIDIERYVVAGD